MNFLEDIIYEGRTELNVKEFKSELREQMILDIQELLVPYKNKDIGLRLLSEKTQISEKTLRRSLKGESLPHTQTVHRFYEHFFKVAIDESKHCDIHKKIKLSIQSKVIENKERINDQLENLLRDNKVFRDIFLFTRTGAITKQWILEQFGLYGMEMINVMLKDDLVVEKEKGVYVEGAVSVCKGPETTKKIIIDLIQDHLTPEMEIGENHAFYLVEGVTEKTMQDVMLLTQEYKRTIEQLVMRPEAKGDCRLFTTCAVDRLQSMSKKGKVH